MKLSTKSNEIYSKVYDAMQQAEEFLNIDGIEYNLLMQTIANEAVKRMTNFVTINNYEVSK